MNNSSIEHHDDDDDRPYLAPSIHYAIGSLLITTMSVGAFLNFLGLLTFAKNKHLRSPTNVFILSLILGDFLMATFATPLAMISSFNTYWYFGEVACKFEGFIVYFIGMANMYTLCAISLDRYVVIAKPLLTSKITHRVAVCCVSLCWFFGFFWAALPLIGWNHYQLEAAHTSCSVVWESDDIGDQSYIMAIFIFCLIVPICLMIFAYYNVFMTIRSVSRNSVWDMNSRVARRNLRIEKKMARTIFLMVGVFLLAWSPYAIVSFWAAFGHAASIPVVVGTIPAILAKSSSIFNPLIYVATNKQFRMAFYEMIPCEGLKDKLLHGEDEKDDDESDDDGNENQSDRKTTTTQKITMVAPARNEPQEEVTQNEDMPPSPDAQGATGGVYTA